MRRFCFFFGLLFHFTWLSGQGLSQKKLLRKIKTTPQLSNAFVGIYVEKMDSKKKPTALNGAHYMTPASNTKLLTFLASTQTFSDLPTLEFAIDKQGQAHFKSTGYPLLFHPFYPDSTLVQFIEEFPKWIYHPPNTKPKPMGSGWAWDDYKYYFAAPSSVFPIYGNTTRGVFGSSEVKLVPPFPFVKDSTVSNLERYRFINKFKYNPQNWKEKDTLYRPFIPNDTLFVKLLESATKSKISLVKQKDSLVWKPFYTANETLLYKALLHESDNGIAEALLLMIANRQKGIFTPEAAIDSLQKRWSSWLPDPLEWVDGSGVSRYNMVTPRTLVAVLQKIEQELSWETIQDLFPKSGVSGTLKAYPELKEVFAKTGTLRHNHNLSGFWVSAKGERYAFSIMVNHFTKPTAEIRQGISELLTWLQKKMR